MIPFLGAKAPNPSGVLWKVYPSLIVSLVVIRALMEPLTEGTSCKYGMLVVTNPSLGFTIPSTNFDKLDQAEEN